MGTRCYRPAMNGRHVGLFLTAGVTAAIVRAWMSDGGEAVAALAHAAAVAAVHLSVVLVALSVHEWAHGAAALACGDTTARDAGRLTLNPVAHFDPIGLVLVPLLLAAAGSPVLFGWARPVPVDFARLRHPRSGMAIVAAAGPASNLVLAGAGAAVLHWFGIDGSGSLAASIAWLAVATNLALAMVNLLPLYPMDGGRIASAALPARSFGWLLANEGKMFAVTVAVLVLIPWGLGAAGYAFSPIAVVGDAVDAGIRAVVGTSGDEWYAPVRAWAGRAG